MLLRNEKITLAEKVKLSKGEISTLHKSHTPTDKDKKAACKLLSQLVDKLYKNEVVSIKEVPNTDTE